MKIWALVSCYKKMVTALRCVDKNMDCYKGLAGIGGSFALARVASITLQTHLYLSHPEET